MISKYATFILLFTSLICLSQENNIDSLKIIENKSKLDKILFEELPKVKKGETESILNLYNDAEKLLLPKLENYKIFIQNGKGNVYEQLGKFDNAMTLYKKSLKIATDLKDDIAKARSFQCMGVNCGKRNLPDSTLFYSIKAKEIIQLKINTKDSIKNQNLLLNIKNNISTAYFLKRDFVKCIDMNFEIIQIAKKLKNKRTEAISYGLVGLCNAKIGNYNSALKFYRNELELVKLINDESLIGNSYLHNAQSLVELKKYNEAEKNTLSALELLKKVNDKKGINTANQNLITLYKKTKEFDKIHNIEDEVIKSTLEMNLNPCHLFVDLAEVYRLEKNYSAALKYFNFAEKSIDNDLANKKYFFKRKSEYFKSIGNENEFIKVKEEELKLKEKENSVQLVKSVALFNTKYQTAQKEAKIKTQQLQIEQEKINKYFAFGGIGLLALTSYGGFLWFRNKQKQDTLKTQNTLLSLQQNLNAMQLDNLNKQLDPHEIKNILANISPEIQRNAPDAYNKMTKLLNLTRASLSSNSITDSIENQLQQIDDYLSLEKTVLPVPLSYTINNTVDTIKQIPRLLLKNLVENAIKHGIKNKKEGGEINIDLSETDNKIKISVDDTGIGRQQAISLDSGIGTSTYINLFETLNKTNTQKASFNIIDKQLGTKVEIIIPIDYKYV